MRKPTKRKRPFPCIRKKSLLQTRPTKKPLPDPTKKATPNKKENLAVPVDPIRRDVFSHTQKFPAGHSSGREFRFFSVVEEKGQLFQIEDVLPVCGVALGEDGSLPDNLAAGTLHQGFQRF